MTAPRTTLLLAVTGLLCAGAAVAAAGPATTAAAYAPASSAAVRPGAMTFTAGGQCTSSFVFTAGGRTFLGQAAHCAGTGTAAETDGCDAGSLPLGTPVEVEGASRPGRLAYSSWLAMQAVGEQDANACAHNDFALVELDPVDVARTNPSVPVFGGPVGVAGGTAAGDVLYTYGSSSLRQGLDALSPKVGLSLGDADGGWTTSAYTLTPGVPGDSGSGVMTADGRAVGTLSTLALAPLPLSNGVSNLALELAYARAHGVPDLQLVPGDVPFTGTPLSLLGGLGADGSGLLPAVPGLPL